MRMNLILYGEIQPQAFAPVWGPIQASEPAIIMNDSAKSATAEKDPVCGMTVDPSTAKYKFEHSGKAYYFCCAHCLEKFRNDPVRYLTAESSHYIGHAFRDAPADGSYCPCLVPPHAGREIGSRHIGACRGAANAPTTADCIRMPDVSRSEG